MALANPAELAAQRAATAAFISADPTELDLVPQSKVRTTGAAYRFELQPPRAPQDFKVIWTTDRNRPVATIDGKQTSVDVILLGAHDAELAVHDLVELPDGRAGEIVALQPGYGYESKALVVLRG